MQFSETLEMLEQMFEKQKLDNRDIQAILFFYNLN